MKGPLSVLLLAAGESRRLGGMKPLLPFGQATLLEYQLDCLTALPEVGEVLVVLGHEPEGLLPLLEGRRGVRAVVHQGYGEGPASSLRAGLRELSLGVRAILIAAVDQPRPRWVLERLIAEHLQGQAAITAPVYEGRRGHPTLFAAALLPELLAISEGGRGLREVMSRHRGEVRDVELDTPAVLLDINTEEDYQAALRLLCP